MNDFDFSHSALHRIDLNLLVAFDALMQERHVSRAAARLHLGQPAMSHALARLRQVLNDPLFTRNGTQMEPSARALELAPGVHAWLEQAHQLLLKEPLFDPAQVEATLALSTPDGLEAMLYPPLIAALHQRAPRVGLRTYMFEADQQLAALDQQEVDLLISAAPLNMRDWHSLHPVLECGFVALYSRNQLSLPLHPSLSDLAAYQQVASSYRGNSAGVVDQLFAEHGLKRNIVVMSASLMATGSILQQAPLVSIQPALYLPLFASSPDISHVELDSQLRIQISLIWHRRNDNHPLHRFLRQILTETMATLFGPLLQQ
jgi:LysR family transcriptional activator of mexEF-oprN operon